MSRRAEAIEKYTNMFTTEYLIEQKDRGRSIADLARQLGLETKDYNDLQYAISVNHGVKFPRNGGNTLINLKDTKFGKWTVLEKGRVEKRVVYWWCQCDCGSPKKEVDGYLLRGGRSKTCGCGKFERNWSGYQEISGTYWESIIDGANKRNFIFNITKEYGWNLYLAQNKQCFYTKKLITFGRGYEGIRKQTASLDRINSLEGYIEGNVQWVHKDVNRMKWEFTHNEFIDMCKLISKNFT